MQDSPFVLGFTAGELSPWLSTRFDLQAYQRGAAKLQNFMVQPYGGLRRRCGSEFVSLTSSRTSDSSRLVPFCFSENDSLMLELFPGGMRIFKNGKLVQNDDGSTYQLSAPWTSSAEVMALHCTQVNDVIYITSSYREPLVLSRYADNDWRCEPFAPEPFPRETYLSQPYGLRVQGSTDGYSATLTLDSGAALFHSSMVNKELVLVDVPVPSQTLFLNESLSLNVKPLPDLSKEQVVGGYTYTEHDESSGMYSFYTVIKPYLPTYYNGSKKAADYPDCFLPGVMRLNDRGKPYEVSGDWEIRTHGEWNAVWELWRSYDTQSSNLDFRLWNWTRIRTLEQNNYSERKNYVISGSEDIPCRMVLVCRSASSSDLGAHIYFNIQGGEREHKYLVTSYISSRQVKATLLSTYLDKHHSFYSHKWSFGSYGPRNGYPTFTGLHQGRLWMGGFRGLPTTLIGSTINDFTNFAVSSADDSALHLTLATDNQSRICWICPSRSLLVGTSNSEWTLAAPDGGVISATNAAFTRHSSVGSEPYSASGVENTVFYVQRGGKRLREISYKLAADGFTSTDTSLLSEHLFSSGVKEWVVQRGSNVRLWVLMKNRSLAVLTTNAEQQVTAWQRVVFYDRNIMHLAALPRRGSNEDELWVILYNKYSKCYSIERIVSEDVFLDGCVTSTFNAATASAGLHLAGLPGFVYPDGQPENAVSVRFDQSGKVVIPDFDANVTYKLGIPLHSELQTLPLENVRTYNTVRQEGRVRLRVLESNPLFYYKSTQGSSWELNDPSRNHLQYPYSGDIRISQIPAPGVGQGFALYTNGTQDFRLLSLTIEYDFHGR